MVKILHCADLHLDSPFTDSLHKGEARRLKLRSAFTNLTRYAAEHAVDLVLIAGDLFDSDYVTKETVSLLVREMTALPNCRFVIAPGNHDPASPTSIWMRTALPENVTVFTTASPECVSFDELGVDVYGYAFVSPTLDRAPIDNLTPRRPEAINILLAHADLSSPLSPYAPTTKEALEKTRMDYVALGHVHACSGLTQVGQTFYAYSGCLEGRGFDELGYKGALSIEIEKKNGVATVQVSEKRFSFGRYEIARVDLTGAKTEDEALGMIRTVCREEKKLGADTTLRLILSGAISPLITNLPRATSDALNDLVYALEVQDRTAPILDAQSLSADLSVRGAFFRRLRPELESEDEEIRTRAARALTLGLAALADEVLTKDPD